MSQKVWVVMTRTENGCPEGHTVHTYEAGCEYDVPEELAEAFFSMGAADPAEAHQMADETGGEEKPGLDEVMAALSGKDDEDEDEATEDVAEEKAPETSPSTPAAQPAPRTTSRARRSR